jgi:hypothetical protein
VEPIGRNVMPWEAQSRKYWNAYHKVLMNRSGWTTDHNRCQTNVAICALHYIKRLINMDGMTDKANDVTSV